MGAFNEYRGGQGQEAWESLGGAQSWSSRKDGIRVATEEEPKYEASSSNLTHTCYLAKHQPVSQKL